MGIYSTGERVTISAPADSGSLSSLGADISAGTSGTVRKVEDRILGGANYLVKFDTGKEAWVDESKLIPG